METQTEPVVQVRDWAVDKIETLTQHGNAVDQLNALAIIDEFHEWLDINNKDQLEVVTLDEISEEEYDSYIDGVERS